MPAADVTHTTTVDSAVQITPFALDAGGTRTAFTDPLSFSLMDPYFNAGIASSPIGTLAVAPDGNSATFTPYGPGTQNIAVHSGPLTGGNIALVFTPGAPALIGVDVANVAK